jgi:chaperonin cofactor prefoldin
MKRKYKIRLSDNQMNELDKIRENGKVVWYQSEGKVFLYNSKTEVNLNVFKSFEIMELLIFKRSLSSIYDMDLYVLNHNKMKKIIN